VLFYGYFFWHKLLSMNKIYGILNIDEVENNKSSYVQIINC